MADKNNNKKVEVQGVVVDILNGMEYKVLINYSGIEHTVFCYVSGRMRKNFIEIKKGDLVIVSITLYDINKGVIVKRLNSRKTMEVAE